VCSVVGAPLAWGALIAIASALGASERTIIRVAVVVCAIAGLLGIISQDAKCPRCGERYDGECMRIRVFERVCQGCGLAFGSLPLVTVNQDSSAAPVDEQEANDEDESDWEQRREGVSSHR
jgi:hypothetical protein